VPTPIFELTDLRVAVIDTDLAVSDAAFDPSRDGFGGPITDSGEALAQGWVEVIPGASLSLQAGESLALVGESASGKSLILMGGFGLLAPGARVIGGETRFGDLTYRPGGAAYNPTKRSRKDRERAEKSGTVLEDLGDEDWAYAIGTDVGFLFQNPVGSWMPVQVIGEQSGEAIGYHENLTQEEIDRRVFDALGEVKLPKSNRLFNAYSTELSRGMAQRAMLAAALTKSPHLLIADEPLNGLDASVAAAIMDLIMDMRDRRGMAMIIVTHDLRSIPGEAPRLVDINRTGCVFADRCGFVIDVCRNAVPESVAVGQSTVACHRAVELDLPGVKG
jgi:ABC-type dipeptide/oligopeptide/nickel transport system ATPase component